MDNCSRLKSESELVRNQSTQLQQDKHSLEQKMVELEIKCEQQRKRYELAQEELKLVRDRVVTNQNAASATTNTPAAITQHTYMYEYTNEKVEKEFILERYKQLGEEKEKLENELFETKISCEKLIIDVNSLKKREMDKQTKYDESTLLYEKAQEQIQLLEDKVHKYKKYLQKEGNIHREHQEQIMEDFAKQSSSLQQQIRKVSDERKDEQALYEEQIEKLKSTIAHLENLLSEKEIANQNKMIKEQQEHQSTFKNQLEEYKKRTEQRMNQLREETVQQQTKLSQEHKDSEQRILQQRDVLNSQIDSLRGENKALTIQLEDSSSQLESIRRDFELAKHDFENSKQSHEGLFKEKLKDQYDKMKKQHAELSDHYHKKISKCQEDFEKQKIELNNLLEKEKRISNSLQANMKKEQSLLQASIQKEIDIKDQLKLENQDLKLQIAQLYNRIEAAKKERSKDKRDCEMQTDETIISLEHLTSQQERFDDELDAMNSELRQMRTRLEESTSLNEKSNQRVDETHHHLMLLNNQVRQYREQYEYMVTESSSLKTLVNKLETQLTATKDSKRYLEEEISKRNQFITQFVGPIID